MFRTVAPCFVVLGLVTHGSGCTAAISEENAPPAAQVKPVAPPKEMVGKWHTKVSDGKVTRTSVYHFQKDGQLDVDVQTDGTDTKHADLVKRAVIGVEKDRITVVDLAHVGADGVEDRVPAARQRKKVIQITVKGDELHWTEVDQEGKPVQGLTTQVLKKVKE